MKNFSEDISFYPLEGGISADNISRMPDGDYSALPEGLAMALAQDTAALARFTNLSTEEQDNIIRRARAVCTRDEMKKLVRTF